VADVRFRNVRLCLLDFYGVIELDAVSRNTSCSVNFDEHEKVVYYLFNLLSLSQC